jgi:hypothetical protein
VFGLLGSLVRHVLCAEPVCFGLAETGDAVSVYDAVYERRNALEAHRVDD